MEDRRESPPAEKDLSGFLSIFPHRLCLNIGTSTLLTSLYQRTCQPRQSPLFPKSAVFHGELPYVFPDRRCKPELNAPRRLQSKPFPQGPEPLQPLECHAASGRPILVKQPPRRKSLPFFHPQCQAPPSL